MFFEHLALNDEMERVASRKALALARVRAEKSFGRFIRAAKTVDERDARLTLVAGDLEEVVKQACADCDHHAYENILETVQTHLGMVVEARRPKMCPYHNEVTDISLASGDPQSGFAAMAQHAWGANHCQGEYDGRCNFKPEMVTQTYWDQKAEKAEERRRDREQQRQLEVQLQPEETENIAPNNETENPVDETPVAPEPSAVGMGTEPAVAEPQMAMAASTREAEALKTVDVEQGGETPSPKMDKRKWTPENVRFLDNVDSDEGPHPTRHQDIAQPAQYKGNGLFDDDGRFEQTDAALEKQDVEKSSNPTDGGGPATSTWPNKGQADPVTSSRTAAPYTMWPSEDDYHRPEPTVCSHCGSPNERNQGQCVHCGQDINSGSFGGYPEERNITPPDTRDFHLDNPNEYDEWRRRQQDREYNAAVDPDKNPIAEFLEEAEAQRAISEFNAE